MALSGGSKGFLVVLVLLAVTSIGGVRVLTGGGGDGEDSRTVAVEIPEGSGVNGVAAVLAEEGVINSALAFRLRARFDDRAARIRPGSYQLSQDMGTDELLEELSAAPEEAAAFSVTVPEGLTVEQTLTRLGEAEGSPHSAEEYRAALALVPLPEWVPADAIPQPRPYDELTPYEGLLFPDTYEFRVDLAPDEILVRLVQRTEELLEQAPERPDLDRYQTLVVASLIEREARVAEERPTISSVIRNRTEQGMRLQIDASSLYATGQTANTVTREDTQRDSPWNTYVTDGLPPTPISGSGVSALQAAAQPADTPFLFYVVSDPETGEHAFATSLEEHNRNVAQYRAQRDGG